MSKSEQTPEEQQAPEAEVDVVSAESEMDDAAVEGQDDSELSSEEIIAQLREKLDATQTKADESWDVPSFFCLRFVVFVFTSRVLRIRFLESQHLTRKSHRNPK